jgi:hypothetical protein
MDIFKDVNKLYIYILMPSYLFEIFIDTRHIMFHFHTCKYIMYIIKFLSFISQQIAGIFISYNEFKVGHLLDVTTMRSVFTEFTDRHARTHDIYTRDRAAAQRVVRSK